MVEMRAVRDRGGQGFTWRDGMPDALSDYLELFVWPEVLYALLLNYLTLSGPLLLLLKIWLARRFWRAALRRIEASDEPAF